MYSYYYNHIIIITTGIKSIFACSYLKQTNAGTDCFSSQMFHFFAVLAYNEAVAWGYDNYPFGWDVPTNLKILGIPVYIPIMYDSCCISYSFYDLDVCILSHAWEISF